MKAVQITQLLFNLSLLKRKLVYHMYVLFFLAFYGSVLCLR